MKLLRPDVLLIVLLALTIWTVLLVSHPARRVAGPSTEAQYQPPLILTQDRRLDLADAIPLLAEKRVVFVGENHDRYDHHLNQLAIIKSLHQFHPDLAIGLEMFQQPFQSSLDAFVAATMDERELLDKTEYFRRWNLDYRLYRPILRHAREHGIPLVALNVPREVVHKVATSGLASLDPEERIWIPDMIDKSDADYRERLKTVFEQHEGSKDFESFLEAQLLWDEAMAARIAQYLGEHPNRAMVVIVGNGHLAYGSGIPKRLQRRLPVDAAIILQADHDSTDMQGADYLLPSEPFDLPPIGRLGLRLNLENSAEDGLGIQDFMPNSPAREAGMQLDDRIVAVDGQPIQDLTDLRLALQDRRPGERIAVKIRGTSADNPDREQVLDITLQ